MVAKDKTGNDIVQILVVEDSPTQGEQLRHILEENRYGVTLARNGREALKILAREKPNLVLSDIVMPEMDGYELCKQIRSSEKLQELPVMLVTTLSSPQDVIKALQCGANSFVKKPYEERYLISRINYIVANRQLRKNERVQTGLYIDLSGQRHFITAERQQILDMLISTYDEAVNLNRQLARSYDILSGLYRIAEGLNKCTSERQVAERTLERAMELPGVKAGWIALQGDGAEFHIPAALGLPPALQRPGALEGDCMCRARLRSGDLESATNMLECERLMNAQGDTGGLRYHASIPLWVGDRRVGVMNLASAEGGLFSEQDLKTLNTVGNQVAVALERARLYEHLEKTVEERTAALRAEIVVRKKAEDDVRGHLKRIRALHEIDLAIASTLDLGAILNFVLEKTDLFFPYPAATTVRLIDKASGQLLRVACRNLDLEEWKGRPHVRGGVSLEAFQNRAPATVQNVQTDPRSQDSAFFRRHGLVSYLGVPMIAKDEIVGILGLYTKEEHQFTRNEVELLSTLASQAAIAIHNAQLYESAVQASKVKDEFLSVMSHELRTPLNVVMGYTAMIKDGMLGEVSPKQDDALGKILSRVNDQLGMTNNILFATAIESATLPVNRQVVILAELFNDLQSTYDAMAIAPDLTLRWECGPDLPILETDRAKLKHILQNLIDNAMKFTDKGAISISARHDPNKKTISFAVADSGVGISQEMLPVIFEKFRQVDSSETRLYGGVGMGLYIVKKFTEMLGGIVEAQSELGKGSQFTVTLPLNPVLRLSLRTK